MELQEWMKEQLEYLEAVIEGEAGIERWGIGSAGTKPCCPVR